MSRATLIIQSDKDRADLARMAGQLPLGARVEIKAAKRTLPQNARLHAMLTEVARQIEWHGKKLPASDWKFIFLDALKRELRMVPNIDGTGFVNLGRSTSDLSKEEMSDLMELIAAFGARHGVVFKGDEQPAAEQSDGRSA
ncbi:recombination protein NinB [Hansschlegelia sp.]|uniref:recombination protein NinB n=1 Tax=Hansschlegelia sp. TaxID=2041892 RepID=UPI002C2C3F0C|nr:recombination protein NinB [Hansschlegelia sp.]HVI27485.1 recombination protein NinB [Hansschlegelia sp.]